MANPRNQRTRRDADGSTSSFPGLRTNPKQRIIIIIASAPGFSANFTPILRGRDDQVPHLAFVE